MILTSNNVLLWPSCATDKMYRSTNQGSSWSSVTVPGAFLFQPLCDAGNGVYLCGDARTTPYTPISLYRSLDEGLSWAEVTSVNLHRPTTTYWRDVIRVGNSLLASACCVEGTSNERHMQLFESVDDGATWDSLGNPFFGPYGGMQAIYQMCATESNIVFAGCQPDSTILRWPMPNNFCNPDVNNDQVVDAVDQGLLEDCLGGPPVNDCEVADLNCNGWVDAADMQAWFCMFDGGSGDFCCSPGQPAVPAVSTWGMVVATLFVLAAGTVVYRLRSRGARQFA